MTLPNFFILGAPKAGTTAIAQYLSEHPQVFMSNPKEPHHFNTDDNYRHVKLREDYERLFDSASAQHVIIGEASVHYLSSREAVPQIEKTIPRPRYLVMLRNPVEMAYSLHEQMHFSGLEDCSDFARAWTLQDERRNGMHIPRLMPEPRLLQYRQLCSLGAQLQRIYTRVDPDRVHVIFNDDLRHNPRQVWLSLLEFLGIDDDGRCEFPVINDAKVRRSRVLSNAIVTFGMIREKLGIRPLGSGILTYIDQKNRKSRTRPAMSPRMRDTLRKEFAEDVALLADLTKRDLSHWR